MSLDFKLEDAVFNINTTHNHALIARHSGLYTCLWYPEEVGMLEAEQLIPMLEVGIADLSKQGKYKHLEPKNGWGSQDDFLDFCKRVLVASKEYPYARPRASR